jgi:hypothetical protein
VVAGREEARHHRGAPRATHRRRDRRLAPFLLADGQAEDAKPAVGKARVVPARGGEPLPVAADVTVPTWAPQGHAVAYLEAGAVKVVGKPGAKPRVLHEADALGAADLESLDWVAAGC